MAKREPQWKIIFLKKPEPLLLYNFRDVVLCIKHRDRETFDIYEKVEGEWELMHEHFYITHCACGRNYNGFKLRDSFMNGPRTLEERREWFAKPMLCMICFYKRPGEWGDWMPRKVRKELGLED